jgi:acetyl esterase
MLRSGAREEEPREEDDLAHPRSTSSSRRGARWRIAPRRLASLVGATLALALLTPIAAGSSPIDTDVAYKVTGANVRIGLDVYLPSGSGPFPGLVIVHGGGFRAGGKGPCDHNCWSAEGERAAGSGFAAFVIDYRLACSPNNVPAGVTSRDLCGYHWERSRLHAAVKDVHSAIAWVRANAAAYDVDAHSVGVLGGSAGGNLAAMAGVTDDQTLYGRGKADAVAVWSPALLTKDSKGGGGTRYIGCDMATCPKEWREAGPTWHVSPGDAPTYIANSTDEIMPLSAARDFAEALTAASVPNTLTVLPGSAHERRYEDQVWDETMAWLHQYLG